MFFINRSILIAIIFHAPYHCDLHVQPLRWRWRTIKKHKAFNANSVTTGLYIRTVENVFYLLFYLVYLLAFGALLHISQKPMETERCFFSNLELQSSKQLLPASALLNSVLLERKQLDSWAPDCVTACARYFSKLFGKSWTGLDGTVKEIPTERRGPIRFLMFGFCLAVSNQPGQWNSNRNLSEGIFGFSSPLYF